MRHTMLAVSVFVWSCESSGEVSPVSLAVEVDGTGLGEATNEEGFTVRLTRFRAAISDLEFTIEGEVHASLWEQIGRLFVGVAHAHAGHFAGGDVTGELPGRFLIEWTETGAPLGMASLLPGDYHGANFGFGRADADDGLEEGDPILGHTFHVEGTASRDGRTVSFTALLDIDDDTQMVGAPFELDVDEDTEATLGFGALTVDPVEGDTMFDGIDFETLDADGDDLVEILPGEDAHNILRRRVQVHDNYVVRER